MDKNKEKNEEKSVAFFERNSWYHRLKEFQEDGTIKYNKKGGFATQEEAEASYWEYDKAFIKQQRIYYVSQKKNKDIMFSDYLIYWFEQIYSSRIQSTTRMLGAYTLYDLILPSVENDIKLRYLSVEYVDALLKKVATICTSAGNKGRELLSMAMKDAIIDGFVKYNPIPETKPYPRKKPTIQILTKKNIKKLLKAAKEGNWFLEILLGLFCGLRKGEILGLKFDDFDLDNRILRVSRQIVADPDIAEGNERLGCDLIERDPKTDNSFRALKIPMIVAKEVEKRKLRIEKMKEKNPDFEDNGYISASETGKAHSLSSMNIALGKICKRNGLPHITVHGLRHMFATILLERGVPLVKISGLLGHASVNTTFEYYCDVMDEQGKIIAFMNDTYAVERTGTEG